MFTFTIHTVYKSALMSQNRFTLPAKYMPHSQAPNIPHPHSMATLLVQNNAGTSLSEKLSTPASSLMTQMFAFHEGNTCFYLLGSADDMGGDGYTIGANHLACQRLDFILVHIIITIIINSKKVKLLLGLYNPKIY